MVERIRFGEEKPQGTGMCSVCGKRVVDGDPDIGGIQVFVGSRLLAEYCSLECELKSKGVKIFEGELTALLDARKRKNG